MLQKTTSLHTSDLAYQKDGLNQSNLFSQTQGSPLNTSSFNQLNSPQPDTYTERKLLKFYQEDGSVKEQSIRVRSRKNSYNSFNKTGSAYGDKEDFKKLYKAEKAKREALEAEIELQRKELINMRKQVQEERDRMMAIRKITKDLEAENRDYQKMLNKANDNITILQKKSKEEKKEMIITIEKAQKTSSSILREIVNYGKKLKEIKPNWRPNTQNHRTLAREVLSEMWEQLKTLILEKEQRDSELFMSNKDFINTQFSEKKTIINKRSQNLQDSMYQNYFRISMRLLGNLSLNVDELNNTFDNCILDEDMTMDSRTLGNALVKFFDRFESLRSQKEFKAVMEEYGK